MSEKKKKLDQSDGDEMGEDGEMDGWRGGAAGWRMEMRRMEIDSLFSRGTCE